MSSVTTLELQQRLSEQLQALSQVSESLTLRLLELEERLSGLEDQLLELQTDGLPAITPDAATHDLLAATEERIARLEDLLTSQTASGGRRHLQPLPVAAVQTLHAEAEADLCSGLSEEEAAFASDPFPEDEEQPFMDELSA